MARPADKDRILWLLQEQGGTSNQQIRSVLDLDVDRYKKLVDALTKEGIVEKYRCHGGGIRLTEKGDKKEVLQEAKSAVQKEKDLYAPFVEILEEEADENEESCLVFDTSSLRKSGKWANPDITKVSLRTFQILRSNEVFVTTYELKQWKRWGIEAVYEAASHRKVAHESYLVLEWARDMAVEGLEEILSCCTRFGVGLITLHPYYKSFRYTLRLDAEPNAPSDDYVEEFLGYIFERDSEKKKAYDELWNDNQIK
jgi:DNA-binding MarR family transcriptional regulator